MPEAKKKTTGIKCMLCKEVLSFEGKGSPVVAAMLKQAKAQHAKRCLGEVIAFP